MNSFVTEDGITVEVIRSLRREKTMSLRVSIDRAIVVVPAHTPIAVIHSFVLQKRDWIAHAMSTAARQVSVVDTAWYRLPWLWFGEPLQIVFQPSGSTWAVERRDRLLRVSGPGPDLSEPAAQQAVSHWYRTQAAIVLPSRVSDWSQALGYVVGDVRIKEQKTRWGSCSSKGNLNFNWRLMMAPMWIVDYVIVHELCHLRELNHSPRFWRLVAVAYPRYQDAKDWLKANGAALLHQDAANR